jgi:SAM-dependent methyltransferase
MSAGPIDRHALSYNRAADAYERGRPEYPPDAVAYALKTLSVTASSTVLDLAAGTGKFTRALVSSGARILAVEPVPGMRAKLASQVPGATVLDGTAEGIPLPDGTLDAVTVAQAFHWFRGPEALAEIRRVLNPGGGLALVWNVRDETVDWVYRLTELMDPHGGGAPRYRTGIWRQAFQGPNGFSPLQVRRFPWVHEGTPDQVVDRAGSTSFVAGLSEVERKRVLDGVRQMLREHPLTRERTFIGFPYITEVYTCFRQ